MTTAHCFYISVPPINCRLKTKKIHGNRDTQRYTHVIPVLKGLKENHEATLHSTERLCLTKRKRKYIMTDMPVVLALGKLKQEDHKVKASLGYSYFQGDMRYKVSP